MRQQNPGDRGPGREASHRWTIKVGCAGRNGPSAEGHLAEQRISWLNDGLEILGAATIAAVYEPGTAAVTGGHAEREAVTGVGDRRRLERQRADRHVPVAYGLDVERGRGEPGLGVERVKAIAQAGRPEHPHPARMSWPPAQEMPERHEVDEVIGMEVAHGNGIQPAGIEQTGKPWKGALAEIEQD